MARSFYHPEPTPPNSTPRPPCPQCTPPGAPVEPIHEVRVMDVPRTSLCTGSRASGLKGALRGRVDGPVLHPPPTTRIPSVAAHNGPSQRSGTLGHSRAHSIARPPPSRELAIP